MWYCVVSSFIFLTNAIIAYSYSQYVISVLWVLLSITSVVYHSLRLEHTSGLVYTDMRIRANKRNEWLRRAYMADVLVFTILIIIVIYTHYNNMTQTKMTLNVILLNIVIFSLLGYILFIYFYGEIKSQYCFHKYSDIAEKWHSTIHLCGSLAHHLMFLM